MKAPVYLGVDVARFGDNKSVVFRRQGLMSWLEHVEHRGDTMSFAETVAMLEDKYNADAVFVDAGGIGGAVIDRLRQLGRDPIDVNFGGRPEELDRYANKRAEIWCRMRDWLKLGGCLPNDEQLLKEMVNLTYTIDVRDRYVLEKKSDLLLRGGGSSPDLPDALATTFAYHIPKRNEFLDDNLYAQYSVTEYDINNGV
jgi:phage terminase large subunit